MPQHIQAPDGSVVEFPDGMNDDQIAAVMQKTYGGGPRPTSQSLGFMEGASKPFDNAARALEAGARRIGVPTDRINAAVGMPSAAQATQNRQGAFREAEKTQRPGTLGKIAGEVVGTIPIAAVTKNPFAVNAASGALLSDAKTPTGVAADAAGSAILGHYVGKGMDAAADFIKPVIEPAVRRLNEAGVKLTPGMVKGGKFMAREDKAMSRPGVGERISAGRNQTLDTFNTATVNKALDPLGIKISPTTRPGHDAVEEAHQAVSDAYDQVVPNMAVQLDNWAFATSLAPAVSALKKPERDHLKTILNNQIGNGQLVGQQLKNAQGEIRRLAKNYSKSTSADDKELGRVLWQADDELTQAMLLQNPKLAPELQKVNKAFRGLAIVEDAAGRADNGVISTGQLKQSVRRADQSARKNASAQGNAFLQDWSTDARNVIPSRTPDSGTAGRNMAANPFARLKGAAESVGYEMDNLFQNARLAPRPQGAQAAAKTVKRLKGPVAAASIASAHSSRD